VTSLNYRKEILSVCEENQILIVEDAAYTEIYYDKPPPRSYYSLSDGYGVIKMSSFSKITLTGLRVGWIQARKELVDYLIKVRFDMGTSPLVHYVLTDMISSGRLDSHILNMRKLYKEKCLCIVNSLKTHCGSYLNFSIPSGGFFLWVDSSPLLAADIVNSSIQEGLLFPSGNIFYNDLSNGQNEFRLAFTRESLIHLEETGIRLQSAIERILD
jgi:2-aminoadipate transaminase